MTVQAAAATLKPTPHAKHVMAQGLYSKLLLRQRQGNEYVVLHLLCQGIEIALKGLLLARDFGRYKPLIRGYGHDLIRHASIVQNEFKFRPLRPALSSELQKLNAFYMQHLLRYGELLETFVDPNTIPSALVLRYAWATFRLARRELRQ